MLKRFRIEVEELTVAETLEALSKYEDALLITEAERYFDQWPQDFGVDHKGNYVAGAPRPAHGTWKEVSSEAYRIELGARRTEEVIAWNEGSERYDGRRVVVLERIDLRDDTFAPLKEGYFEFQVSGMEGSNQNSGTNP